MSHDPDEGHAQNIAGFGVKKSNFNDQGTTAFSGSATIDVVINGENVKQSIDNFFANATTTVLTPVGGAGAIPTLEQFTGAANVRGLESGPGVLVALSLGNGIEVKHNFQVGVGGVAVLKDPLADSPTIRSIVAGPGAAVSANNGAVQISFTGDVAVTNTVIVNSVTDLPTPVADVITLDAGIVYQFESFVNLSANRIVMVAGTAMFANDRIGRGIVSDNVGACVSVSGANITPMITDMVVNSTAGSAFDVNTGAGLILNNVVTFESAAVSTFDDTGVVSLRTYSVVDAGDGVFGMLWSGTCAELNVDTGFCRNWDGVLFDCGTAVFTNGMTFGTGIRMTAKAGATIMSGAANSANIGTGAIGLVTSNKFIGAGTHLTGIDPTDARWDFHKNTGVQETRTDAILTMHGNATETTIVTQNVPVLVAGTWVVDSVSQMTGTTAGRATDDSEQPETLPLSCILKAAPASGGSITMTAYIAIDGVFQPNSGIPFDASSGTPAGGAAAWQALLTNGQFIEVYIANNSGTGNIVVSNAILRIN